MGNGGAGTAASGSAIRHFLSAVHEALDLPAPLRAHDRLPYLSLLEQRAGVAKASIGRLAASAHSDELDYTSEGDHILHQIADLPPDTYRHGSVGRCPGKSR
ncbi:MAG TPA: hypothetical protein VEV45_24545 [Streptosporangiaceae bacterium]|nr:hypothetical protein [Streptosporangiaceae bacterium]